eukprot:CCRYP_004714-RA/>CCRYP_004714-RA protein AED:0.38 eAED:-0.33 QI:0/-1/0/1/-1/0/1/0/213
MKEPDYVMKIMATGGVLEEDDTYRSTFCCTDGQAVHFKYKKPFDWHFCYRHAVDDHNNLRHALPSLEDTWITQRWEIWVFSFLLAITEVNVYLALKYFVWPLEGLEEFPTLLEFRRQFSWLLIDNQWLTGEDRVDKDDFEGIKDVHGTVTAPPHAKEYRYRQWVCTAKARYQQYVCKAKGCRKQVRTCCRCKLGYWLCDWHLMDHVSKRSKMD